jgi:hypothetical protein
VKCVQKKQKFFNKEKTEYTEIKKLKRIYQSLPSLFALFSPVNLFGYACWVAAHGRRLVRVRKFIEDFIPS